MLSKKSGCEAAREPIRVLPHHCHLCRRLCCHRAGGADRNQQGCHRTGSRSALAARDRAVVICKIGFSSLKNIGIAGSRITDTLLAYLFNCSDFTVKNGVLTGKHSDLAGKE